ncbi:MAG: carboxypeptidase regulatory-like domain-containing protein [Jatrophihabitans sp.]|uniref:carboxypeptidase regulatory-like domain-containing protein n=1 Tax=Jatrophihabitans sp. TaxID=1932789 RepID=UPI00391169FF
MRSFFAVVAALAGAGFVVTAPQLAGPAVATTTSPGAFVALAPTRVLDTRTGLGAPRAAVSARAALGVQITGRGGVPSTGVCAVELRIAVRAPSFGGYVTAYAYGTSRPATVNVAFPAGEWTSNAAVVKIGSGGRIDLYNSSAGNVELVADVSGYFRSGTATAPGAFQPLPATRVLDTRTGTGAAAQAVGPRSTLTAKVTGVGGVPATGVSAVVLTVTVIGQRAGGYLSVYPRGAPRPAASTISFTPSQTIANLVVASVGLNGSVAIYNGSSGSTQVVADVAGYYRDGAALDSGMYVPRVPFRFYDSRTLTPANGGGPLAGRHSRNVALTGSAFLPGGAQALVLNVSVTAVAAPGYLTVYPSGDSRPVASSLNFAAARNVTGLVVVPLGADGSITVFNGSTGSTQVVVDVVGFYGDGTLGAVTGRTVDRDGSPVAGVVVNLSQAGYADYASPIALTGADGRYVVAGLPASGDNAICFGAHQATGGIGKYGYSNQCYMQAVGSSDPVSVSASQTTTGIDGHLSAAEAVTGKITDSSGHPLKGVDVRVGSPDGQDAAATTAADGSYTLRGLDDIPSGDQYTVCGHDSGGASGGNSAAGYLDSCSDPATSSGPGSLITGVSFPLPGAGGVSGRVTDGAGHPVAGVPVYRTCCGASFSNGALAVTDALGRYTIRLLDPNSSTQICFKGSAVASGPPTGYLDRCYKNVTVTSSNAPSGIATVALTAGQIRSLSDETLPAAGALTGSVRDAQGNPLGGVEVQIQGPDPVADWSATTRADGTYRIDRLPGQDYTVCAEVDHGYVGGAAQYGYVYTCRPGTVTVVAGQTTTGASVVLTAAGAISGKVTDVSGHPLKGVSVDIGSGTVDTASDGTYEFTDLYPRSYTVCFYPPSDTGDLGGSSTSGYLGQCFHDQPTSGTPDPVAVTSNHLSVADAKLPAGGAISGTVTDSDGAPVAGLYVSLATGPRGGNTVTAADGTYKLGGLPSGTYTVCFEPVNDGTDQPGHLPSCYDGVAPGDPGTPVDVTAGSTTTIDGQVPIAGGVHGVVKDSTGHPLTNVNLSLTSNSVVGSFATTDSSGSYSMIGLRPGTYALCVGADFSTTGGAPAPYGYAGNQCHDVVVSAGWTVANETLIANGVITGTVTSGGSAAANVTVHVTGQDVDGDLTTTADDGTYTTTALAPGTYTVCFSDPYGRYVARCFDSVTPPATATPVTVSENVATTADQALDAVPPASTQLRPR